MYMYINLYRYQLPVDLEIPSFLYVYLKYTSQECLNIYS